MPVGVIGLGKVGSGIATTLVDDGYDVVGYDLDAEARTSARENGVAVAEGNDDVARRSSEIVLSLPDPDASRAVVETIAATATAGTTVFDTSTLSPSTAVELHETAAAAEMSYHDCPVTGGALGARQGELTMLIGGDVAEIRDHRALLETLTESVYHIGDVGDAQFVKLVHNHVGLSVLIIFIEGLLLAEERDVDPAVLYRTLRYYTDMYNNKLDNFFGVNFEDNFEEHFASGEDAVQYGLDQRFDLGEAHKDIRELNSVADEHGTQLFLGDLVEQIHRLGVNAGYGGRPHPEMLELFEELSDVRIESTSETRAKSHGKLFE